MTVKVKFNKKQSNGKFKYDYKFVESVSTSGVLTLNFYNKCNVININKSIIEDFKIEIEDIDIGKHREQR